MTNAQTPDMSANRLKEIYWNSCRHEGYLNMYVYRRLSLVLAVAAVRLGSTPNQITMLSFACSIAAACLFTTGNLVFALWALIPFHIGKILDCADGQLASLANKKSALGAFLDPFLDRITDIAILGGLAVGYYVSTHDHLAIYLFTGLMSVWFVSAYLNSQAPAGAKTLDTLRASTGALPKPVSRLLKWDGGFTGLITTLAVLFGQTPLLIGFTLAVSVVPLPLQFMRLYRKLHAQK